jgi:hypothetical protein
MEKVRIVYAAEEGPRRGLSERGWKERRPKEGRMHLPLLGGLFLCAGQSFTYMVTTNKRKLMVTTTGMSRE